MNSVEFASYWGLLCERYNRSASGPMSKIYREVLAAEGISAEEWAIAVSQCIRFEQFWPSPQQLIDYARPQDVFTEKALGEWDEIIECVVSGKLIAADAGLRKALRLSCNGSNIRDIAYKELTFVKREFVDRRCEHYRAAAMKKTPNALEYTRSRSELTNTEAAKFHTLIEEKGRKVCKN